jgi:DNA-binding MarR family transcriptional regulator
MDARWLGNLVGALALAIDDEIVRATEEAAGHGASVPAALATLRAEPGISIEQLRRALSLTHSGGARLVDRLAGEGLVERAPGFGRRLALQLTPAGAELSERILTARDRATETALAPFDQTERLQLASLLERMLRGLVSSEARSWQICRMCDRNACTPERCPVEAELREHAA